MFCELAARCSQVANIRPLVGAKEHRRPFVDVLS